MSPRSSRYSSNFAAVHGALQLGVAGTLAATTLAEAVHMAVLSTTPFSVGKQLTQGVYSGVRLTASAVGKGGEALLALLERHVFPASAQVKSVSMPLPLGIQAVLNGVVGDRLLEIAPAVAMPMRVKPHLWVRSANDPVKSDEILFVHGLCMHDEHWQGESEDGGDFGALLYRELGARPLYLRYNSGLAIAENGRRLATLLAQRDSRATGTRPSLHVVAHSLGGLVVRSALASAAQRGHRWPKRLASVVFLGTPHEGAPLERAGRIVESMMSLSRFSAPWAMLARLRSVAIRQLGDAHIATWPEGSRSTRVHVVAGTHFDRGPQTARDHWGDGLVPVSSALARSVSSQHLPVSSRAVLQGVGHLSLIRHPDVAAHLLSLIRESR